MEAITSPRLMRHACSAVTPAGRFHVAPDLSGGVHCLTGCRTVGSTPSHLVHAPKRALPRSLQMMAFGPADLDTRVPGRRAGRPGLFPASTTIGEISPLSPQTPVDTGLDPFGRTYFAQQIALYHEIAGRGLDQNVNEYTVFDHVPHRWPATPIIMASERAVLATPARSCHGAADLQTPPRRAQGIDMGCGRGPSSELASYGRDSRSRLSISIPISWRWSRNDRSVIDTTSRTTHAAFDD